jgi:hypothetical protein
MNTLTIGRLFLSSVAVEFKQGGTNMPTAKSPSGSPQPDIRLSLSFNGPMFFDFSSSRPNGMVDIYVPYCPFHEAGFFFSTGSYSETDLYNCAIKESTSGPVIRAYTIGGKGIPSTQSLPTPIVPDFPLGSPVSTITPHAQKTQQSKKSPSNQGNVYILSLGGQLGNKSTSKPPSTVAKRLFKLSVPMPKFLSALYDDKVEVIPEFGNGPTGTFLRHCTAIRFYYEWNGSTDVTLMAPGGQLHTITPPIFAELPAISDIEIRYEGLSIADENDPHSDAHSCFASLATLAGTTWWLDYGDGRRPPTNPSCPTREQPAQRNPCPSTDSKGGGGRLLIHSGADCHAPIIVTGITL